MTMIQMNKGLKKFKDKFSRLKYIKLKSIDLSIPWGVVFHFEFDEKLKEEL